MIRMNKMERTFLVRVGIIATILTFCLYIRVRAESTLIVPDNFPTIQSAIDAAIPGDTIIVRPGTYLENLTLNKSVMLTAESFDPNDPTHNTTIIDGGATSLIATINVSSGVSPMPTIRGFVIRNGIDGIKTHSEVVIEYNYFVAGGDQLDYSRGSGGINHYNVYFGSSDDGIDLDNMNRPLLIEHNRILYSGDDGIEIRLQDDSAPTESTTFTIQNNEIIGCNEDGIQLIDYTQTLDTNRRYVISGNLIANCRFAGIGLMPDQISREDYSGADILEAIRIYNNTLYGNDYGISGGDNLVAFNNVISNSITKGIWKVQGPEGSNSVVAYTLFYNNGVDTDQSDLGDGNLFGQDPRFAYPPGPGSDGMWETVDDDFSGLVPLSDSPAIDVGVAQYFAKDGKAIPDTPITGFGGTSPDLGWKEFDPFLPPTSTTTPTLTATSTPPGFGIVTSQISSSSDDAEEAIDTGSMSITSSDLELGADGITDQWVGMRFNNISIPRGASVLSAYLELEVDETGSDLTSVVFNGQASVNASAFSSSKYDISSRPRTMASILWANIPAWPDRDAKWQTPDLTPILQEIVNQPNWIAGNSIVLMASGTGRRTAESFDGEPPAAPKLVITYTTGDTPTPTLTLPPTSTPTITNTPSLTPTATASLTPVPAGFIRFAVIGDYGNDSIPELNVADLVKSWDPDFIITTGDNNYRLGAAETIDQNIGQYYHEFISPYTGAYGLGAATNRFFPSLGNHDWETTNAQPYLDYFTLPGIERYYDFVWGPVHLFAIDSDNREPDGNLSTSTQGLWLQTQLNASNSPWNLVYMHHPPYSSGANHGSTLVMQWPYQAWGADAVMAGHDHEYERIVLDGFPYFVNGLGGASIYSSTIPVPGSEVRYNGDYGAMLVEASELHITFQFISRTGAVIDTYTLGTVSTATPTQTPSSTPTASATVSPTDSVTPAPTFTFTNTPSPTATNSPTITSTFTFTNTPSPTATNTPTITPTFTSTSTETHTPLPTATNSPTITSTFTPTATESFTPSPTATNTPTITPTFTSTSTETFTPSPTMTPTATPTPTTGLLDAFASDEVSVAGTVNGDYLLTREDDGIIESITELESGGKPQFRYSYLEHKWLINVAPGNVMTLYVNAWSSGSIDGDSFSFSYSTDDINYSEMFTVANTADTGLVTFVLPPSIQGTLYVRVADNDQSIGSRLLDTIYVDQLFVRTEIAQGNPPAAPSSLSATAVSTNQINLNWIDNATNEYGVAIERSTDSLIWSNLDTVGENVNIYLDVYVSPNTTYFYRVQAFNGSGISEYSNEANATTPDGLSLTANGYKVKGFQTVDLYWNGNVFPIDIYRDDDLIATNISGNAYTDHIDLKGGGSYLYQVCEVDNLMNCSAVVQVDF